MRLYLSSFRLGNRSDELLRMLGGKKRAAVILNAVDLKTKEDRAVSLEREINELKNIGLEPIEIDLRNYFGKADELKKVLMDFNLIWVRGGNSFVLRRALRQSGCDRTIEELLNKDACVYGGYSAGIDILGSSLHGSELVDDPNAIPDGYESPIIWDCLNILSYAIAPHYKSDHPESADVDKMVEYLITNHMPFIALRDGEAIVRDGDKEMVVG